MSNEDKRLGILEITFLDARLIRDTELFSKMDPYVLCTIGKNRKRTKTHNKAGKSPEWTEKIIYKLNGDEEFATLSILDEDFQDSDLVGTNSKIIIKDLKGGYSCQYSGKVDIYYQNQKSGDVTLSTVFKPNKNEYFEGKNDLNIQNMNNTE
jgi:Ca2+-dependent lipid-binding protein